MPEFEPSYDPILTARSLIRSIDNITFPVRIEDIAKSVGIHDIIPRETEGYEGILITHDGLGVISYNQDIKEDSSKRFTIAHELGHFLIKSHKMKDIFQCKPNDISNFNPAYKKMEAEANFFSAHVLMPEEYFKKDIYLKAPSKDLFDLLTEKYGSSLTSTFIRYKELTDENVAVILSEKGAVKWTSASQSFKFHLDRGSQLPKNSYAIDFFNGGTLPDDFQQVYNNGWFKYPDSRYEIEVHEFSVPLISYNQVLTLLWVFENDSDIDEDEEEELDGFLSFKKR